MQSSVQGDIQVFDSQRQIETLERRHLVGVQPPVTPIWGQLDATQWVRVLGLARLWEEEGGTGFEPYMEDLVIGYYGRGLTFAYLILGQRDGVSVYMGLQDSQTQGLLTMTLRGTFPAIELDEVPVEKLGSSLRSTSLFNHTGRLTGVPTLKARRPTGTDKVPSPAKGGVQQIARLLRGLYGEKWGYFVLARPVDEAIIVHIVQQSLEQINYVSALVKKHIQIAPGTTLERTDREAQHCMELLEKNLERLNLGKAEGMWQVEAYFFASEESTLDAAKALLKSIFAGKDSVPDPLRTFKCSRQVGASPGRDPFITLMNSRELSTITQLPKEALDKTLKPTEWEPHILFNPIFSGLDFQVEDDLCFVLMPFGSESLEAVYQDFVKPTVERAGLRCVRADDIFGVNVIIEDIWAGINRARFVIAELTGKNPNVFYEVGICHTVGKDVIFLAQSVEDVPFDLRHLRVLLYDYTPRGCQRLAEALYKTVLAVMGRALGPIT